MYASFLFSPKSNQHQFSPNKINISLKAMLHGTVRNDDF